MALSGSISTGAVEVGGGNRSLTLSWTATQNTSSNTSKVSWTLKGSGSYTGYVVVREIRATISSNYNITGTYNYYHDTSRLEIYPGTLISSGSFTITHNSNGVASFGVTVEAAIYQQWEIMSSLTRNTTFNLDTIARASQPSITYDSSNVTKMTINTNPKSTDFRHDIRYLFGTASGAIATNITSSYTWTIPTSLYQQIPNSTIGTGTIYVDTKSNGVTIGTKTCAFTCHIPTNSTTTPTCSISTGSDEGGHLVKYGKYIQGKTKIPLNITATGKYGASVSESNVKTTVESLTYSGRTPTITVKSTSATVSTKVTDTRGLSNTASKSIELLAYSSPVLTIKVMRTSTSTGTSENILGKYCRVSYTTKVRHLNDKNSQTLRILYKKDSSSSWTTHTVTLSTTKGTSSPHLYVNSGSFSFSADDSSRYNIKAILVDDFETTTKTTTLSTGFALMHLNSNGKGIAFGKLSESASEDFGVGMPAKFYGGFEVLDTPAKFSGGIQEDIQILETGNCNNITVSGNYYLYTEVSNTPIATSGWLVVRSRSSSSTLQFVYQEFFARTGESYYRTYIYTSSTQWSSWSQRISGVAATASDYVIENGYQTTGFDSNLISSGRLSWQKWASGKLEYYGSSTSKVDANVVRSSWAGGYECATSSGGVLVLTYWGTYPTPFAAPPHSSHRVVSATGDGDYWLIESTSGNSTTFDPKLQSPFFKIWRGSSSTSVLKKPHYSFHVVGRWK